MGDVNQELLKAAKAFVRWVDDCWGVSELINPETLLEYEEAMKAIAAAEKTI